MKTRLFIAAAIVALCVACEQPAIDYKAKGAALLAPFKANLKSALIKGMESGPVEAINACRVEAPQIAEGLSIDGVVMGRSSHRLRNYDNATPDWLAPTLRRYADGSLELVPIAMEIEIGRMGYAEPIIMQPMCLTCHGETLEPAIAERISTAYPDDRATGFKAGDFRGVFWVEFPER